MKKQFKFSWINTKLSSMLAVADETGLHLLEFECRKGLEREVAKLCVDLVEGENDIILSIAQELEAYFDGALKEFKTPLHICGTAFQKLVWQELMRIPYGQTRSYAAQAEAIGKPTAYRAVANANGANQLAIVMPCHRIINSNGDLGGYGGGVTRKQWLLDHEKKFSYRHC